VTGPGWKWRAVVRNESEGETIGFVDPRQRTEAEVAATEETGGGAEGGVRWR
jgi:macrodomain Ter protein organizer (MatP/YcbG family)